MLSSHQRIIIKRHLESIKDVLLVTCNNIDSNNIERGKIGIAIFFSQYHRLTNNEIYNDVAYELITNIQATLSWKNSVKCIHELCEIGIGIEYLLRERFFEADSNYILEDFDNSLSNTLNDSFIYLTTNEIIDIGRYFLYRFSSCHKMQNEFKKNLDKVIDILGLHISLEQKCSREVINLLYNYSNIFNNKAILEYLDYQMSLFDFSLVESDPFRWSYLFIRLSQFSERCAQISRQILDGFLQKENTYHSRNLDNLGKGNAGRLICSLLMEENLTTEIDKFIKRLIPLRESILFNNLINNKGNLGILTGIAGVGLSLIAIFDRKSLSWLNLL